MDAHPSPLRQSGCDVRQGIHDDQKDSRARLVTTHLFSSRPFAHNHLVAVLGALGTRLARALAFGIPAPDGHGMLVRLGFTTTTSMRMVVTKTKT